MTSDELVKALLALECGEAGAYSHEQAEDLVMQFLKDHGYTTIVDAWYATKKRLDFWYE